MLRFFLFLILFYIIYKILQFFLRYLTSHKSGNPDVYSRNEKPKSKYDNVEEADFKEIKPDDKNEKEENPEE
jgi:hypothetical protein